MKQNNEEEKQKEVQKTYLELQMLDQHIKQLQKQLESVNNQVQETDMVKEILDDIKDVKTGTEILVQVANGIFTKATIKNTQELIVNAGANIAVVKDVAQTKDMLTGQSVELQAVQIQMNDQLERMVHKAQALQESLRSMIE